MVVLLTLVLAIVVVRPTSRDVPNTTVAGSQEQPARAVWPMIDKMNGFNDPRSAAREFAVTYLGFKSPVVGRFIVQRPALGSVAVTAIKGGPVTTVDLRRLNRASTWWITGATSADIVVTAPTPGATVSSPLLVSGRSTAFEAVVNVEIRADAPSRVLAKSSVMGGSMGVMGPFHRSIPFAPPPTSGGALVLRILSPRDGNVLASSVVRLNFRR